MESYNIADVTGSLVDPALIPIEERIVTISEIIQARKIGLTLLIDNGLVLDRSTVFELHNIINLFDEQYDQWFLNHFALLTSKSIQKIQNDRKKKVFSLYVYSLITDLTVLVDDDETIDGLNDLAEVCSQQRSGKPNDFADQESIDEQLYGNRCNDPPPVCEPQTEKSPDKWLSTEGFTAQLIDSKKESSDTGKLSQTEGPCKNIETNVHPGNHHEQQHDARADSSMLAEHSGYKDCSDGLDNNPIVFEPEIVKKPIRKRKKGDLHRHGIKASLTEQLLTKRECQRYHIADLHPSTTRKRFVGLSEQNIQRIPKFVRYRAKGYSQNPKSLKDLTCTLD